jgi:protein SCO1/2
MALLADLIACRFYKIKQLMLIGLLMLGACSSQPKVVKTDDSLPFYNTAVFDAEWINKTDVRYKSIHTIDTFKLHNQLGHVITADSLKGKIYVANFFFSSCTLICPKMMDNLKVLQDTFINDKNICLVSFSVTPWIDSETRLKEYGSKRGIVPGKWQLLTGSKERIYNLARQSYFAEKTLGLQKNSSEFLHTETMLLIDRKARIRGIYNATQIVDIGRVTEDIKILEKEAL